MSLLPLLEARTVYLTYKLFDVYGVIYETAHFESRIIYIIRYQAKIYYKGK